MIILGASREAVREKIPEIAQHLEETPAEARLIPIDNWAAMCGLSKGSFVFAFKKEAPELSELYRTRLASYYETIKSEISRAASSRLCDLREIADKYDTSVNALQAVARRMGIKAPTRKIIFPARLLKVAKVGMTLKELAQLAGLHPGSLKDAKNKGYFKGYIEFEHVETVLPSGHKIRSNAVSWLKPRKK